MQKVQLTVLLATRNGEQVLQRTLEGYRRVTAPSVGWKIVIVDNGSTDSTPAILQFFKRHLPLEVLQYSIAGRSQALNAGIEAVEGRLTVLTDDDAIPSPSFLNAWAKFLDAKEQYGLFGGSIEPVFDVPPPQWMRKDPVYYAMMFAERNLPEGPVGPDEIYGANMAVRASVLDLGFRFNKDMGANRLKRSYRSGGETEFCMKVSRSGIGCWFASEPLVQHIVRQSQLTRRAWANRAYNLGRARAYLMHENRQITPAVQTMSLVGRLSQIRRRALKTLLLFEMLSPIPEQRYRRLCDYHLARGFRDECAGKGEASSTEPTIASR
jgi:glycosyltransferase involved in cell wall biosynthesis